MANVTTVTRPYAKAVLAVAKATNTYAKWTDMLNFLSGIVQDPLGYKVLSNLAISSGEKVDFICAVAKDVLDKQGENLIKVLARSKRLLILPELYRLYEQMRKNAEKLVEIDLTLAEKIDQAELNAIQAICENNFVGQVILTEQVNASLISGGVAQIGNRVIDASIIGRLQAMRNLLRK